MTSLLVINMDSRICRHNLLLAEVKAHPVLGNLLLGVIPTNEPVSYAHSSHQSLFTYNPTAPASKAYMQIIASLVRYLAKGSE